MKKIVIGLMILVMCSSILLSIDDDPFASIMGVKWGVNAIEFKTNMKYDVKSYSHGFSISYFPFGDIKIEMISFIFKNTSSDPKMKFKEKNYVQFIFEKVIWDIHPDQFDTIFEVFKKKYGEPTKINESKIQNRMGAEFNQIIVLWEKNGRMIQMYRYADQIDKGLIIFMPKSEVEEQIEKKEESTEQAADIL